MKSLTEDLADLEAEIHAIAGQPFNIGDPLQLGETLFDRLSLPGGERLEDGSWDVAPRVLERLASAGFRIASLVLKWQVLQIIPKEPTEQDGEELLAKIRRFIEEETDFEVMEEDGTARMASEVLAEFDAVQRETDEICAMMDTKTSEGTSQ